MTPLHFDSILIVTYGRSGSTLLQGVLNSIEGVEIKGENMNMCFHLFKSYQAILEAKNHKGLAPEDSFYGSDYMDVDAFLANLKESVKKLLLANVIDERAIRCYGFKEIRYGNNLDKLYEFLDFLQLIFPKCCFIFNTRNNNDVVKSWINLKWKKEEESSNLLKSLHIIEDLFSEYQRAHFKNCFHISYEDVIEKNKKLEDLFSFLGANYDENRIESLLNIRHSHKPNQRSTSDLRLRNHTNQNKVFLYKKTAIKTRGEKTLERENKMLKEEVENYKNSLSWKFTKPFRRIISLLWKK